MIRLPATVGLAVRLTRRTGVVWTAVFATLAAATVAGYRQAYPTALSRSVVAAQIGSNLGFQALYGRARALDTLGGFAAWRVGGLTVVIAAIWGALSATRLLRGEEEAGRLEHLLAGRVGLAGWTARAVAVAAGWQVVAGLALWSGLAAAGVRGVGAGLVAAGIVAGGLWGVAIGGVTSQVFPTRRRASVVAGLVVAAAYLLRVVADGTARFESLRWASPFGWAEETRPFAGDRWWPLGILLLVSGVLAAACVAGAARRDHLGALLADHDRGPASSPRLAGPWTLAARLTWRSFAAWGAGLATFGAVMGLLARDVAEFAARSPGYVDIARRLGIADPTSPAAFVGLANGTLIVGLGAAAAAQAIGVRADEAEGRLDLLLAGRPSIERWVAARAGVAAVGLVAVALCTALGSWVGTLARGGGLGLGDALSGGVNLVPLGVLVLGVGTLAHGLVPRWTGGVAVGVVAVGYLLELIGAILRAPAWVLDLSPFHHVAPVPAVDARLLPAVVMAGLGVLGVLGGLVAVGRRDLAAE